MTSVALLAPPLTPFSSSLSHHHHHHHHSLSPLQFHPQNPRLRILYSSNRSQSEVGWDSEKPGYNGLIKVANRLMIRRSNSETKEAAVRILRLLFPPFLLELYRMLISPIQGGKLAAMMVARVTALSCQWLMGHCAVNSVDLPDGSSLRSGVFVEKCKYLEESKCVGICINTCKLPTQEDDILREQIRIHGIENAAIAALAAGSSGDAVGAGAGVVTTVLATSTSCGLLHWDHPQSTTLGSSPVDVIAISALIIYVTRVARVTNRHGIGRMRCLAALARWEELNNLCKEYWTPAEPAARLEMAPLAARAVWNMGEWDQMAEYVSRLDDGDETKLRVLGNTAATGDGSSNGTFFRAVLLVHKMKIEFSCGDS
ncbi:hypothetical protein HYC85_007979 [Camellia sinensis]|uniref:Beta-carotene isomerase D27-like C-terminal domain-containing protein n=1 Tax=Camellia sinensis TaxID=4442 RepID=A0A7J7HQJ1_CAMSI|nr:hypothetical protein HYC85_007979 [Camellia sinensis]